MSKSSLSRRKRRIDQKQSGEQQKKSSLSNYEIRKQQMKDKCGIWWLASYPKSGNTWVRYMLALYFGRESQTINDMDVVRDDIRHSDTQTVCSKPCNMLTDEESLLLRPAMLHTRIALHRSSYPLILKTHNRCDIFPEYMFVPWLVFGAIYIVRDPRDVVISLAAHTGQTIDQAIEMLGNETAAVENKDKPVFKHYLSSWSNHVRGWFHQQMSPGITLRYEDMLERPEDTLQTILHFMCIDPIDSAKVERAILKSQFKHMKGYEEISGFNEAGKSGTFFNHGTSGHHKDILTKKQADKILHDHKEVMQDFDYV